MIINFKIFEGTKYKNEPKYDNEFKFKIDSPVKFLKDSLNGYNAPDLTMDVFFIQVRSDETGIKYYMLYDFDNNTLNWVEENALRLATEKEIEEGKIRHEAKKYNI